MIDLLYCTWVVSYEVIDFFYFFTSDAASKD